MPSGCSTPSCIAPFHYHPLTSAKSLSLGSLFQTPILPTRSYILQPTSSQEKEQQRADCSQLDVKPLHPRLKELWGKSLVWRGSSSPDSVQLVRMQPFVRKRRLMNKAEVRSRCPCLVELPS
jgi:hypothetical protein